MTETLRVIWPYCKAYGACAELLPRRITLDPWGYPIVDPEPIPASEHRDALQTVRACPKRALLLMQTDDYRPGPAPARSPPPARGR
jgi:ferredoxin